jgi:hypothetical protein
MKPTLIDDLMTDSYAQLYALVAADLPIKAPSPPKTGFKNEADNSETKPADGQTAEPATKGRIKGVGRRELLKRAESAGFTNPQSNSLAPSERRQSTKDREGLVTEITGGRRSVSVVVPTTPRRTDDTVLDLDTGSDSELSEMSNEEIDEIGDDLPSPIKDALGVGRKSATPDIDEEQEDEEEEGEEGEEEEEEEEGDQDEMEVDEEGHQVEHGGEVNEDGDGQEEEEEEEEDEDEEEQYDEDEENENEENAEDADDEGNNDDDRSAMDIDESALVEEQMRAEIRS